VSADRYEYHVYQDWDKNCTPCWGKWFGYSSWTSGLGAGHIHHHAGPFNTAEECLEALGNARPNKS
jgi:hypothetical protein